MSCCSWNNIRVQHVCLGSDTVRFTPQVGLGKDTKATFTLGFTKSNELFVGRLASAPPAAVSRTRVFACVGWAATCCEGR